MENFFGTSPDEFTQGLVSGTVDTGTGTTTVVATVTGPIPEKLFVNVAVRIE